MAIAINPIIGVDLTNVIPAGSTGIHKVGVQVFGDDGKRYVFAKAGGAIPGATAVCTVNASTFAATSSGGSYLSPAAAMATGDFGWFAAASV
jgi:hypothetical protein